MSQPDAEKQLKAWIRSQRLICEGTDIIFETVDQTRLEKFEHCIELFGGHVRKVAAAGHCPMGPRRTFKILRATAAVPRPGGETLVTYWAKRGNSRTRYAEIS